MAQLIKLQDYVSRYEQNIFLYPSRYVRLKKQQWMKVHAAWEKGTMTEAEKEPTPFPDWLEEDKQPFIDKVKGFLKFGKKEMEPLETDEQEDESGKEEEESEFQFASISLPTTEEELKYQFLDQLFRFQMKWASTTLTEKSFVDKKYYFEERLKYFLQRFPDTFLVLYHPIFLLKKAPIEVETIIITPTETWCISFLEDEDLSVYIGSKERFWLKRNQKQEEKVLSPLLALDRTEKIVKKIYELYEIDLPTHKVVLSRNGYFDYPSPPYDIKLIEKRNYESWFQAMRAHRSPLKHVQLKAAQALLQYCQTSSFRRLEWDAVNNEDIHDK